MKQMYATLTVLFILLTSFGGSAKTIQNNVCDAASSWISIHLSKDNDSMIVAVGDTLKVNRNYLLNNTVLVVYGTLNLANGKLKLDNTSKIIVGRGGKITGTNSNEQIIIGNRLKFSGSELSINGPRMADNSTGVSPLGFVDAASLFTR